jgi:hypothetical protein
MRPSFTFLLLLCVDRGRREDRVPAGTHGPCAEHCASNAQGENHRRSRKQPGLPCAVVRRLMARSPWRRIRLASIARRIRSEASTRSGDVASAKLDTSNGCRDHTLLPYATTSFVLRAAKGSRGSAQSCPRPVPRVPRRRRSRPPHPKPAFRDDARSAPRAGWDGRTISTFSTSEKENYFSRGGLTNLRRDLPDRQRVATIKW